MNQRRTVSDYMATQLTTLTPDMEINRAMVVLLEGRVSGAPVLGGSGELVGVLSKRDCLRAALHSTYHQELGGVVGDYMSKDVQTLDAEMDLVEATDVFLGSRYRRFPVMREGRLVGQISRADVLRALAEQWQ